VLSIFALALVACSAGEASRTLDRFEYSQVHMGGRVRISVYAAHRQQADTACEAAFARIAEIDALMSDYRPDSELNRLVARAGGGPVPASPELIVVLRRAAELSSLTEGAFDVTCAPLVQLWRQTRRTGRMPDPEVLTAARSRVGWERVGVDPEAGTVTLQKGTRLDLGGIAKGFACDEAIASLRQHGVDRALVEAGGDMAASGPPPGKRGWAVDLRGLGGTLHLRDSALSTSGDAEQSVRIGSRVYSHILDPRTGLGLTHRWQVSVLAPDGLTSDGLATALSFFGERESGPLLERYGARAIFVRPGDANPRAGR
jgi:FAD:protein FMN transferase